MNVLELFKNITTLVFDIDGVLTDGSLFLMPGGAMVRRMNTKDGYGLQLAIKKGYHIVVISGGDSPEAEDRLAKLGVKNIFMRCGNKLTILQNFITANNLQPGEILFMGDDMPDYDALMFAGLPCCPRDAVAEIKEICKYISPLKGGDGCVRDVIEKTLKLRGHWEIDTLITSR
jgi:3-deoxy-D-manno-octulosonate 8-phosphate phosphatase (KDO 8-P phosphatase)